MNTTATFTPAVTETKTVEVSPAKVTLELTPEQALAVYKLVNSSAKCLGVISGYTATDEQHTYAIYKALAALGLRYEQTVPKLG